MEEPALRIRVPTAADLVEMLGHVGHRFCRPGQLAGTLNPAGLHVAAGCAVEVASSLDVKVRPRHALPGAEPCQPVVRPIKIRAGSVLCIPQSEVIGRRGQVGVGPIIPDRVARVVDGTRQIMGGRSILPGETCRQR